MSSEGFTSTMIPWSNLNLDSINIRGCVDLLKTCGLLNSNVSSFRRSASSVSTVVYKSKSQPALDISIKSYSNARNVIYSISGLWFQFNSQRTLDRGSPPSLSPQMIATCLYNRVSNAGIDPPTPSEQMKETRPSRIWEFVISRVES